MSFSSTVTLALVLTATPAAAIAHHGWSAYGETPQKIAGVIREVQFANPHATIQLEAQDRTWLVVLAPPSRMTARGLTEESLKTGQNATIEGHAHRTQQNEMRAESISLGDETIALR
jgi:Family of unknown function (DUF6152)